jgi:hypothetical protein
LAAGWLQAGPRLGPRRDHIKEQATDGDADRERVGQLVTSFGLLERILSAREMVRHGEPIGIGPVDRIRPS